MDYIDANYYNYSFQGDAVDSSALPAYISRATDIVDIITGFAIQRAGGLASFPAGTIELVKKAVAYQVEYFIQNGGLETANSGQGVASDSMSIGKFGIKQRVTAAQQNADPRVCPMTISILEQTGLMNRQVDARGGDFMGLGGWPIW